MKKMNLIDTNYYWKSWVDWISTRRDKMLQPQNCMFWEKRNERVVKPILKTRNVDDKCQNLTGHVEDANRYL